MLRNTASTLVTLVLALGMTSCLGGGNSVNVYGGYRALDTDDFDGVDDHVVYGGDIVYQIGPYFLAIEGGYLHSEDDSSSAPTAGLVDPEVDLDEFFIGLRATPWPWLIKPYFSIGATYLTADLEALDMGTPVSDDDSSIAGYGRVGVAIEFTILRFGVDLRAVVGSDLDLIDTGTDADYYEALAFIGIGF